MVPQNTSSFYKMQIQPCVKILERSINYKDMQIRITVVVVSLKALNRFFLKRREFRLDLLELRKGERKKEFLHIFPEQSAVGRYFRFGQFPNGFTFLSSLKLGKWTNVW